MVNMKSIVPTECVTYHQIVRGNLLTEVDRY